MKNMKFETPKGTITFNLSPSNIKLDPHMLMVSPVKPYRITIECDGDTTTAKMVINGKTVKTATAKRNPDDKANWRIGAQTAFDRLWAKQEKQEGKKQDGGFKIGDRVVANEKSHYEGKHGRIVSIQHSKDTDFCRIGVEFDEYVYGHDCSGNAKPGHGWWVGFWAICHEKPSKPEVREMKRRAKAGEYIKLVKIRYSFDELGQILRVDGYNPYFDQVFVRSENHPYAHKDIHNMKWHYPDDYYVVLEGCKPEGE